MTEEQKQEKLEETNLEEHINEKEEAEVPTPKEETEDDLKLPEATLGLPEIKIPKSELPDMTTVLTDTKINDLIPEAEPTNWEQDPITDLIKHFEKKYPKLDKKILKEITTTTWDASRRQTILDIQNTPTFKAGASLFGKLFKKK